MTATAWLGAASFCSVSGTGFPAQSGVGHHGHLIGSVGLDRHCDAPEQALTGGVDRAIEVLHRAGGRDVVDVAGAEARHHLIDGAGLDPPVHAVDDGCEPPTRGHHAAAYGARARCVPWPPNGSPTLPGHDLVGSLASSSSSCSSASSIYNRLVQARNRVDNAWAQVEVQLKRRYDLIPNLVETVKGYASHEQQTFERVTQARKRRRPPAGPPKRPRPKAS